MGGWVGVGRGRLMDKIDDNNHIIFEDNFGYIEKLGYRETWRLLKQLRSLRIGKSLIDSDI